MRTRRLLLRAGWLTRPLDGHVHHFARPRRVGTAGNLPVALLVDEPVTDLKRIASGLPDIRRGREGPPRRPLHRATVYGSDSSLSE